ncbi:MAG: DUF4892 domain-containing protein, partial [Marinomonas sp.]
MVKFYNVFCLLMMFSGAAFANVMAVEPHRGAQLIKSHSDISVSVEVPLDKIGRAGSGWEPEKVIRLQGDHFTSLYKIDRNVLLEDVYSHYRSELQSAGQEVVFECSSRSCGSSNAWANNFFKDYLLYGSDQSQFLLVVKSDQGVYQVLYLNRRGAGDVMVRLDQVRPVEVRDTEFDIVAQMDIQDTPRIRRFINDLSEGQRVVAFVTSRRNGRLSAVEYGDQLIANAEAGLGDQLKTKVRFINLADLGLVSLSVNRVSFV